VPADVPYYPNGKMDSESARDGYYSVIYNAPVSFNVAFDYYENEFERTGWEVRQRAKAADASIAKAAGGVRINARKQHVGKPVTCYVKITPLGESSCSVNLEYPRELQSK